MSDHDHDERDAISGLRAKTTMGRPQWKQIFTDLANLYHGNSAYIFPLTVRFFFFFGDHLTRYGRGGSVLLRAIHSLEAVVQDMQTVHQPGNYQVCLQEGELLKHPMYSKVTRSAVVLEANTKRLSIHLLHHQVGQVSLKHTRVCALKGLLRGGNKRREHNYTPSYRSSKHHRSPFSGRPSAPPPRLCHRLAARLCAEVKKKKAKSNQSLCTYHRL